MGQPKLAEGRRALFALLLLPSAAGAGAALCCQLRASLTTMPPCGRGSL